MKQKQKSNKLEKAKFQIIMFLSMVLLIGIIGLFSSVGIIQIAAHDYVFCSVCNHSILNATIETQLKAIGASLLLILIISIPLTLELYEANREMR